MIKIYKNDLVVRALNSQSRGPRFKTTEWLQGGLSLSSIRGRSNEYQELLGTYGDLVVERKLSPLSDSAALSQLNTIHKKGSINFFL